jgi:hypothetical protein
MTTFFAEVRIFVNPKHEAETLCVEVPAPDLQQALALLMAWKAGLAANPRFDTAMEESLSAAKRRGASYLTMREAAAHLRNNVFA